MAQATVYSGRPGRPSRRFAGAGFAWVHVVDLDGAFAGRPANGGGGRRRSSPPSRVPVQLGGGIRDMAAVAAWLDAGCAGSSSARPR